MLAFLVAIILIASTAAAEEVRPEQKLFLISDAEVLVQGSWRRVTERTTVEIPDVNSVRIECSRKTATCREYVAKLIRPGEHSLGGHSYLFLMLQEFVVQRWTTTEILAKAEPRAADIILRIFLATQAAERESRETEARGAMGARSDYDKWSLR